MTEPTGISEERARQQAVVCGIIADRLAAGGQKKEIRKEIEATWPDIPPSTIYRWIDRVTRDGSIGQRLSARQMKADRRRADQAATVTALPLAEYLGKAITYTMEALEYFRGDDAKKPRNPKGVLAAGSTLANQTKAALAVHQALMSAQRVDEFHAAMIEEIARESPEVAQRITNRLRALTSRLEV